MITKRLAMLRALMDEKKVNAVLVNKHANLQYFSGFRGDSTIIIITRKKNLLVTDGRYMEQARIQSPNFELIEQKEGLWKKVSETLTDVGLRSIGFEGNVLTFNDYEHLKELQSNLKLTAITLDELRQVKDEIEIDYIRKACNIADKAFDDIIKFIRPGIREIDVAARLEQVMRKLGSEKPSFDTIVASGIRGCLPHGTASEKIINNGEFVTMDFGAIYNGYHSDMTRTICVGRANDKQRRIYNSVLKAQYVGLKEIKVGASGKAIDAKVRESLEKDGFAQFFSHALGHSLGLEIHEEPRLAKTSTCEALQKNMLVTDEPGVYIPNFGGLRIEDTVLVTEREAEPLTKSPKHLIEIVR